MSKVHPIQMSHKDVIAGYLFHCPGCGEDHMFTTNIEARPQGVWSFNGDLDKPTFSPSLLVNGSKYKEDLVRCHSFVTDGEIQFLSDCDHGLAGRTVELPEWESGEDE